LLAGLGPPRSSDDLYRYLWDGRVQAAGINPYRYVPAAPELAGLRDDVLWPDRSRWCIPPGTTPPATTGAGIEPGPTAGSGALVPGCTLINRPMVPTIYPPVAQAFFRAVHHLSPPGSRHDPMQIVAAAIAFATTVVLLLGLRVLGGDPRTAVLWAWSPVVALEAGSNAHVDVLAALLTAVGLLWLSRARSRASSMGGGAVLGLAVATKLTPVLVLPALARRRPLAILVGAIAAGFATYLPHVVSVGPAVIGFVPGYLDEEGFADGSRFALLSWLVPEPLTTPAVAVLVAAVAILVARGADPDHPWHAAATMTGAALMIAAPSYPWYSLLLVMLVALGARPEWLAAAAAGYLAQYAPAVGLSVVTGQRIGYGVALVVIISCALARRALGLRSGAPRSAGDGGRVGIGRDAPAPPPVRVGDFAGRGDERVQGLCEPAGIDELDRPDEAGDAVASVPHDVPDEVPAGVAECHPGGTPIVGAPVPPDQPLAMEPVTHPRHGR
jgi:hypothetical protein